MFETGDKAKFTNFYGKDEGTRIVKSASKWSAFVLWNILKGNEVFSQEDGTGPERSKIEKV